MAKGFTVKTVPPKPKKKKDEWDIPTIKERWKGKEIMKPKNHWGH